MRHRGSGRGGVAEHPSHQPHPPPRVSRISAYRAFLAQYLGSAASGRGPQPGSAAARTRRSPASCPGPAALPPPGEGGREGGMQEQRVPACEAGSREPSSASGRVWERFACSRCSGPALFSSPREPCFAAPGALPLFRTAAGAPGGPSPLLGKEAQSRDVTSKPGPQAAAAAGNETSPSQPTSPSEIKAPGKFWRAEGSRADTCPTGICAVCSPAKGSDKSWEVPCSEETLLSALLPTLRRAARLDRCHSSLSACSALEGILEMPKALSFDSPETGEAPGFAAACDSPPKIGRKG